MTLSRKEKLEIVNNILDCIEEYWIDLKGIIFATNLEATSITGYEESEIIGKHFSVLYQEDDIRLDQPETDLKYVIDVGLLKAKGVRLKKNGAKFIATIHFELVNRNGNGLAVKMTLQDTTYRAVNKHKLKRLESRYNSLFQNCFTGVLILDSKDFKIIQANDKSCRILEEIDFENKLFTSYLGAEPLEKFNKIISAGGLEDFELKLTKPGEAATYWVCMKCSYFPVEGVIEVLLFDITEEKMRIEELENVTVHLDEFIYHASHDLRAPLTTLMGLINLAKNEINSQNSVEHYLNLMLARTQHLDYILKDLRQIASNRKTVLDLSTIDFEKEASSIFNEYEPFNKSITWLLKVDQRSEFVTDTKRLKIILRSIIANAVKYCSPTQQYPFVRLSVLAGDDQAIIEVEDNGIGIHPQYSKKIFELFFRGTERSSGSGLGLYLAKTLIEKLEGKITLTSSPEVGSIFKIIIPNKKSEWTGIDAFQLQIKN